MGQYAVHEAEHITRVDDLQEHMNDAIDMLEHGTPKRAAYGYATQEEIAQYGNELLANGAYSGDAAEDVLRIQKLPEPRIRLQTGYGTVADQARYANNLMAAGARPEAAQRMAHDSLFPRKFSETESHLEQLGPNLRANALPNLPPEDKPTYGVQK